jgi:protein tyrosine/serine phosphatase
MEGIDLKRWKNRRSSFLHAFLILLFLCICLVASFQGIPAEIRTNRPAQWATPIYKKELPNLYQVSDTLYRGAQPSAAGFHTLRKMGVKTIVSLRQYHSDEKLLSGTGLNYFSIPISASDPHKADFQKFLALAADPQMQPVFVHCQHGADRTGTAVALYRIKVQGWDREEAIRELREGGYGYHKIFKDIIRFIKEFE